MGEPILTVANQLTILRMALVPALVVLVLRGEFVWGFAVFLAASLTDLLDGLIARWGDQQTRLGAMLDPVADKLLIGASFVVLTWGDELHASIPPWLTVTTLCRDAMLIVAVVVVNLFVERRVFYPTLLGKVSSAVHVLTAGTTLLANAVATPFALLDVLYPTTLVLTVGSAVHYVYRASTRSGPEVR